MTNTLAKQLGITLKPFCVKTEYLTPQLAQDMLDRAVDLGANAYEGYCEDTAIRRNEYESDYLSFIYELVGVKAHNKSTFLTDCDEGHKYNHNILSFPEMCDYLQVHQEGDRLVANEDLAEEEPNLWNTPSAQEVDEDGFTPWNGLIGMTPLPEGTTFQIVLDTGEVDTITMGGNRINKLWYKRGDGPTIVKYKPAPTYTAPVSPVERSSVFDSVEVGSNLERALELVLAVYNGDEVSFNGGRYKGGTAVDVVSRELGVILERLEAGKFYTLKSEEEANTRNEEKEKLDKEIEELENSLQQLKDKREEMNDDN